MKLINELGDIKLLGNAFGLRGLAHDAAAAHAYKQAEREADALFSKESRWYRARAWINTRADELMREWTNQSEV